MSFGEALAAGVDGDCSQLGEVGGITHFDDGELC